MELVLKLANLTNPDIFGPLPLEIPEGPSSGQLFGILLYSLVGGVSLGVELGMAWEQVYRLLERDPRTTIGVLLAMMATALFLVTLASLASGKWIKAEMSTYEGLTTS